MLSAVPVFGSSTKARILLRLRVVSSPASLVQAAKGLRALSRVRRSFSLRGEQLRQLEVWVASLRVRCALRGELLRQPEACEHSPRVRRAFSLRSEQPKQPEACAHFPRMRRAFSLRGPSVPPVGSQEVF